MSLPATRPANQALRCGDRRHAASLTRQRAHATYTPAQTAAAIAKVVRKRLADGQPLDAVHFRNLDDATWSELIAELTDDELLAVQFAQDPYDPVDTDDASDEPSIDDLNAAFSDDEPIPFAVAAEPPPS